MKSNFIEDERWSYERGSFGKVWREICLFNDKYFPNWRRVDEIYYTNALAGEVGELCGMVKKRVGGGTSNKAIPTIIDMMEEIADIMIYLSLMVEKLGQADSVLEGFIMSKIEKNIERMESRKITDPDLKGGREG